MYESVVRDATRLVVSDIAPDELPIFPALSRAYIANPQRALVGEKKRGGTLGFGFAETVIMVTPYVFFVMGKVVDTWQSIFWITSPNVRCRG